MAVGTAAAEGEVMAGLLDLLKVEGAKYLRDILPGGLLNPEGEEAIQSLRGLLAPTTGTGTEAVTRMLPMAGEAWAIDDAKQEAAQGNYGRAALAAGLGLIPLGGYMAGALRRGAASVPSKMNQSGAIVWHGSPHKFDKFDMSKIGTGEGAQAYGHGLYVAESPSVAQSYQRDITRAQMMQGKTPEVDRIGNLPVEKYYEQIQRKADRLPPAKAEAEYEKLAFLEDLMQQPSFDDALKRIDNEAIIPWAESLRNQYKPAGQLYKVDIPDEAVARFLDWDKPLSQQAPEVQEALQGLGIGSPKQAEAMSVDELFGALGGYENTLGRGEATGQKVYKELSDALSKDAREMVRNGQYIQDTNAYGYDNAAKRLRELGIPGIRYLDGGSRSAGQGSSNFVLFDDQMPRILEINGAPTGLQPWGKGEWRTLRGLLE